MVSRLERVRKVSAVGHTHDGQQHQHRDQSERRPLYGADHPTGWPAGSGLAGGALHPGPLVDRGHGRLLRVSHGASLHHQVEYPALVELARRAPCAPPALAHDQHLVGQAEHLGHLAGHQHAPPPPSRPAAGSARRSRCARRRRPRGSARRAAARRSPAAASGPAPPSAGCRPTGCAPAGSASGGRTSSWPVTSEAAARSASRPRNPTRAKRRSDGSDTLRYTGSVSSSPWLLRSSGHSPIPARTAAGTEPGRSALPCTRTVPARACGRRRRFPGSPSGRSRPARPAPPPRRRAP